MLNSVQSYLLLKEISQKEFSQLFENFKDTAFRLELLNTYHIEEELEAFCLFKKGLLKPPSDFNKEWQNLLLQSIKNNKSFSRVRVIDGELTDYQKFEILWGFKKNIEKGEDIRFVIRPKLSTFNSSVPILKDFWLFDSAICILIEYDYLGNFLGVKKVPESLSPLYIDLANEVRKISVNFDKGLEELNL